MKIFALIFFLCIFFSAEGCKKDNPVSSQKSPPPYDSTTVYYLARIFGVQPLRSYEFYVLWTKILPDTSWQMIAPLTVSSSNADGSVVMVGKFSSKEPLDSLKDVLMTLEQTPAPLIPGLPIVHGGIFYLDSAKKQVTTSLDSKSTLGDFSALNGGLVFTSPLSDSLAYTHEFYLMNLLGLKQSPSLLSLNIPPQGWKYGLWAIDLQFTPHEYFFYGLFSTPEGHDSDSANDHYPYPGGWKPQQMNMPSGSIIVTLEPIFYGDSLKFKGPSSFTLLQFNRIQFIEKDKNYPMENVSLLGVPRSGTITFNKY